MARGPFTTSGSAYLWRGNASGININLPHTAFFWARLNTSSFGNLGQLRASSGLNVTIFYAPVLWLTSPSGTTSTGAAPSLGVWHPVLFRDDGNVPRLESTIGSTIQSGHGTLPSAALDRLALGTQDSTPVGVGLNGNIACCAVWNQYLTTVERDALFQGASPLRIRSRALVSYVPLMTTGLVRDWITGAAPTHGGSPAPPWANSPLGPPLSFQQGTLGPTVTGPGIAVFNRRTTVDVTSRRLP